MNFELKKNTCVGCGLCARICPSNKINMQSGLPVFKDSCMMCGQCYSVCPYDAILYSDGAEEKQPEGKKIEHLSSFVGPDDFLTALWSRRSVRAFSNEPVTDSELEYLLGAAHSAPTASNAQNVRYIVIQEKNKDVTIDMMKALGDMGDELLAKGGLDNLTEYYAHKWKNMLLDYLSKGEDALFFNAPLIVLFVGPHAVNATIAATQMNLMAESLGLGACFIGFAKRAVAYDRSLREKLGINEGEDLVCALAIGRPRVKYQRVPARKEIKVTKL